MTELYSDDKAKASNVFAEVIECTANNFPDPRFRPNENIFNPDPRERFDPGPFQLFSVLPPPNADGIGTKPEIAERLYTESITQGRPTPEVFEGLATDLLAMVMDDAARDGHFLVGMVEIIDFNSATDKVAVNAVAKGLLNACNAGGVALLNGETAELGYRASGYGNTRINWNAVGIAVKNPEKTITGEGLQPGQPVVALRETSIRSNGLTKIRQILDTAYLNHEECRRYGDKNAKDIWVYRQFVKHHIVVPDARSVLHAIFGHDAFEQILLPWHRLYPDITWQLLEPSTLYGPLMYKTQGGIDGKREFSIIAAMNNTGGGIKEKGGRMVEKRGLGLDIHPVFPDPQALDSVLTLAHTLPEELQEEIDINDKKACEIWHRGIGFMTVLPDEDEARGFIELAKQEGYEAAIVGEIIDRPEIHFRGHTWVYKS